MARFRPARASCFLCVQLVKRCQMVSYVTSLVAILLGSAGRTALAADWPNMGGNASRHGLTTELGPTAATPLWGTGRSSLIAWHPVTEGDRVFVVRQAKWPDQQPNDAFVVAMDLNNGAELWAKVLPYVAGDWTPWIAGARDGRVYASRSGNGASVSAKMYALDATDGHTLWTSVAMQDAGAYDGVVFAPDGDLIVPSFEDIWRINAEDGATVWHAARVGSVSGDCGGAIYGDALYVCDAAAGGHRMVRYDLNSGTRMYEGPVMPGFLTQNTPFVGPDGTVYMNRCQGNASVDFLYAYQDDGTQFLEKWHVPTIGGAAHEYGVGADGSVYVTVSGPRLARLNPATGATLQTTAVIAGFSSARMALDPSGTVFFSNGGFSGGRLYSYNADLSDRWNVPAQNINIGGPSLGAHGTLVVCGTVDVRAYRTSTVDVAEESEGDVLAPAPTGAITLLVVPNPCREFARIDFVNPSAGRLDFDLFDASGARVMTWSSNAGSGPGSTSWIPRRDDGAWLARGNYFLRASGEAGVASTRIVVTR